MNAVGKRRLDIVKYIVEQGRAFHGGAEEEKERVALFTL